MFHLNSYSSRLFIGQTRPLFLGISEFEFPEASLKCPSVLSGPCLPHACPYKMALINTPSTNVQSINVFHRPNSDFSKSQCSSFQKPLISLLKSA